MADEMTNEQALSILQRIEVEQRTMKDLWTQMTPALRQLGAVIERYRIVSSELPSLEKNRESLRASMSQLEKSKDQRFVEIRDEAAKYKKSLEDEIAPLEKQLKETRERIAGVQGALKDVEKRHEDRMRVMTSEAEVAEKRLSTVQKNHQDFLKKIGAAA